MKRSILILACALLGACARPVAQPTPAAPSSSPNEARASKLSDATVALVRYDEEGGAHAYCSGVWVSPRKILTAGHCARTNPLAKLFGLSEGIRYATRGDVFPDGTNEAKYPTTRDAYRVGVDEDHDLALLVVDDAPAHGVARLSGGPIVQGAAAYTLGHPRGFWWSYSAGAVAAVREDVGAGDVPTRWVQTTAPISPGNSGCGLFNEAGELIGIASWKSISRGSEALAFFVHRDHIAKFLGAP